MSAGASAGASAAASASDAAGAGGRLRLVAELQGHADRVWQVSWSPVALALLSASGDQSVRLWRPSPAQASAQASAQAEATPAAAWSCVSTVDEAHSRTVRTVAYNPDGRIFATGSFDASVGIWERPEGSPNMECIATLEGHENEIKSVAWAASGALLATCSRDKSVWIWELVGDDEFECCCVLQEHTQDVKMVQWHPSQEVLASASYDDTIKIWEEDDGDWYCQDTLKGHTSTVWSLDFDATGTMIASVSDDKSLRIWKKQEPATDANGDAYMNGTASASKGKYVPYATVADLHSRTIYSVSWSKNTGLIATASGDNSIKVLRLETSASESPSVTVVAHAAEPHGHHDVNFVAWCPVEEYQHYLASAGDDGIVRIWCYE